MVHYRHLIPVLGLAMSGAVVVACSDATSSSSVTPIKKGAAADPGALNSSDGNKDGAQAQGAPPASPPLPKGPLISARYQLSVKALGISICNGTVEMSINASIGSQTTSSLLSLPVATVKCPILGELNVAALLGALSKPAPPDVLSVKDGVMRLKSLGNTNFDPPHMLMPSFIAENRSKLASLNLTQNESVNANGLSGSGTSSLQTLEILPSVSVPGVDMEFKDVIHFQVKNSFQTPETFDKASSMLFDNVEFKISLNPISVIAIRFDGKAADLLVAAEENKSALSSRYQKSIELVQKLQNSKLFGGLTNLITGKLNIRMDLALTAQDGLDKSASSDIGESIGGATPAAGASAPQTTSTATSPAAAATAAPTGVGVAPTGPATGAGTAVAPAN